MAVQLVVTYEDRGPSASKEGCWQGGNLPLAKRQNVLRLYCQRRVLQKLEDLCSDRSSGC